MGTAEDGVELCFIAGQSSKYYLLNEICVPALSEENFLYVFSSSAYVWILTHSGGHHDEYAGEMGAERKPPIGSLLCEHIAVLVIFFLIILNFKFSPYATLLKMN